MCIFNCDSYCQIPFQKVLGTHTLFSHCMKKTLFLIIQYLIEYKFKKFRKSSKEQEINTCSVAASVIPYTIRGRKETVFSTKFVFLLLKWLVSFSPSHSLSLSFLSLHYTMSNSFTTQPSCQQIKHYLLYQAMDYSFQRRNMFFLHVSHVCSYTHYPTL